MPSAVVTPFKRHPAKLEVFVRLMNVLGGIVFPPRKPALPSPGQLRRLAVAKTDHLGDLLMITPVLAAIRRQAPECQMVLVVGQWNERLARELQAQDLCAEVIVYSPWGLNRSAGFLRAFWEDATTFVRARRRLKSHALEVYLDLRIWSFNSFLLGRTAGARVVAGFAGREFSSSLDLILPHVPGRPLGQMFLDSLPALGFTGGTYEGPCLRCRHATPLVKNLRERFSRYLVVHGVSADGGRTLPCSTLQIALRGLPEGWPVLFLGTKREGKNYEPLWPEAPAHWVNLAGQTTLEDLVGIVAGADGAIVSDSFVAHLCLSFRIPSVILMIAGTSQRSSFPAETPQCQFVDIADPAAVRSAAQALTDGNRTRP